MLNAEDTKMIVLNCEQWDAIEIIDNLMKDLEKAYPRETVEYLINPATCEIIETIDFGKVRGILNFIATQPFKIRLK